jgi:hypothetical protein
MVRSTDEFFRNQIEECLELAKQAANNEDRAFWERIGQGWAERLRQLQRPAAPKAPDERSRTRVFRRTARG